MFAEARVHIPITIESMGRMSDEAVRLQNLVNLFLAKVSQYC